MFEIVRSVELEERADDPIVGIELVTARAGGGYVIADRAAGRVRVFDGEGRLERALGRAGDGPGELDEPTAAVELDDGRIFVVQRADPRFTTFDRDGSAAVGRLDAQYGFWAARLDERIAVGLGSREERFALMTSDGTTEVTFGRVDPLVNEIPFWIFFATERAAVVGDEIFTNTSLFPTIRAFDGRGDSVRAFGAAPPSWRQAGPPPVADMSEPRARDRIEEWTGTFTVVAALAAVGDSNVVVQYGHIAPIESDPYFVAPRRVDVYDAGGAKRFEDLELTDRVVGGGAHLIVLAAEPPSRWTLTSYALRAAESP